MLWTQKNYPDAMKNLSDKAHNKAIQIANAILRVGRLEKGATIATAISKAKEMIENHSKKRINNIKIHYF